LGIRHSASPLTPPDSRSSEHLPAPASSPGPDETAIAYVALGSNLGDRRGHLEAAFAALAALPGTRLLERSAIFETPPFGPPGQQNYFNAAASLATALSPLALLDALLAIEQSRGRVRLERWGPRTLDLDLLLHGDAIIRETRLTLPHPEMLRRAFVLVPLHDLAPRLVIDGLPVARHLSSLDQTGIHRLSC
jgi:2-amino-4-hydroxy-6-hydroxymethyldihydropteridine diphosphokinase